MTDNEEDRLTHTYTFTSSSDVSSLQYQYIVEESQKTMGEQFWRLLAPCRIHSISENLTVTKYEYFGQAENELGLTPLPLYSEVQTSPLYFDDNQVMTVGLNLSQANLAVIFNPNPNTKTYVKANMTMISLTERTYVEGMKIRRAGGQSFRRHPYSYQIKYKIKDEKGDKVDVVFKLKAYPTDFSGSGPGIVAEKASADICLSVGAPINYVSLVRLVINGEFQGLYNMLEKVDESFVERRWPYQVSGNPVGTLYKTNQARWWLLTNSGWQPGIREFCQKQGSNSKCCPCVDDNCKIDEECGKFDSGDNMLDCCSCTWESNGSVEFEFGNCKNQTPFADYVTLGDSVLSRDPSRIAQILGTENYAQSLLCALAVMNADGYIYNGKNYYWYRDAVSGRYHLILYDQDTTFTRNDYVRENDWTPWNWPLQGNLADALFLPTLFENKDLLNHYNAVARDFLTGFYRSDKSGPLFERMNLLAKFIARFDPNRPRVVEGTQSFINWFITPLSAKLQSQLGVNQTPVTPFTPPTCPIATGSFRVVDVSN
eukprot:TRINITY_DN8638_c0_g2_i2.p1 TRINITY_DN8638_c0_g2~~TRINITY_DN8638_c0_g2_i2.p1  ORF type:complete len:629 (+),score=86.41 TRINITY_DN8638_c0_g2_i2:264-1889(+)